MVSFAAMKIVLATKNFDKIREIESTLNDFNIQILSLKDFPEMPDISENGQTLEENSFKKAKEINKFTGITALADDTGLEVDALNGAPGVFSARYAGEGNNYLANNQKLLSEMRHIPMAKRTARFRCVMTLYNSNNIVHTAEGILEGFILTEMRGKGGFGYDPLFQPIGFSRTLAELTLEEKNSISHRGIAVRKMKKIIAELIDKKLIV